MVIKADCIRPLRHLLIAVTCLVTSPVLAEQGPLISGTLKATSTQPLPENSPIYVRTRDRSRQSVEAQAVLEVELEDRGYVIEFGAPFTLAFRMSGAFTLDRDDAPLLRLQGKAGSESRPTGSLSLTLPAFGKGTGRPKGREYRIEMEIFDDTGQDVWEAQAQVRSEERDKLAIVRILIPFVLEHLGKSAQVELSVP